MLWNIGVLARIQPVAPKRLHPEALACLRRYPFPGNVREPRNILERASPLADGDVILPQHLPAELSCDAEPRRLPTDFPDQVQPLAEMERRYLRWALARHRGDKRSLARQLELSERTFYRKLKQVHNDE